MNNSSQIALVTGANKGIGYEIVARLATLGMTVLLSARDPERLEKAVAAVRAGGGDVHPIALDVTDPASVARAAGEVEERFGRLDILVNNAGILGGPAQAPGRNDLAGVREAFATNVFGVIAVTEAMLPLLRRSPAARIVNMSSIVGSFAAMTNPDDPVAGMPPSLGYVPSKSALNAVTVQYAKALAGTGILVNAACPGYCATDLNNHQGYRTAAQGAEIAVRLATLGPDGPSGGFRNDDGAIAW